MKYKERAEKLGITPEQSVLYADIDLNDIPDQKWLFDVAGHYARPDVFHLEVNDQPQLNVVFESQRKRP